MMAVKTQSSQTSRKPKEIDVRIGRLQLAFSKLKSRAVSGSCFNRFRSTNKASTDSALGV